MSLAPFRASDGHNVAGFKCVEGTQHVEGSSTDRSIPYFLKKAGKQCGWTRHHFAV